MEVYPKMRSKKGQVAGLNQLPSVAILFVLAAVVIAVGAYVLQEIDTTAGFTDNTAAANATEYGQQSLETLAQWMPICV